MKFTIAVHCAIYVVARNSRDDRTLVHWAALVPLFFVHTLRYLPSSAFAPGQVDPKTPVDAMEWGRRGLPPSPAGPLQSGRSGLTSQRLTS
jgi:hypothetical protein